MTDVGTPTVVRPVLAITLSTALSIRNLFLTGVIELLSERFHVVVLASPSIARTLEAMELTQSVSVVEIDPGREPSSWSLLRQLKKKVYMEGRQSETERIWAKYQRRAPYQRVGGVVIRQLLRFVNAHWLYHLLDRIDLRANRSTALASLSRSEKPDALFATHATSFWEEYIIRSAREAGVATAYMVLSWDHLSSKVLLHDFYERVFVWNEHTRKELLQTYPTMEADRVRVVGVPQYDLYTQTPTTGYEEWCSRYSLDPSRRTILFSTMPQVRHSQQHLIVQEIGKAIVGGILPANLQVLVKCHPYDNFNGYEPLTADYPIAIRRTQLPKGADISEWIPNRREIEESGDCLYHCSVNINIFSTVTIEASWFDKPIIHIAFDPLPIPPGRIPCREYYKWEHFRHIVDKDAAIMVYGYEDLFAAIRDCLRDPSIKAAGRRRVVAEYIGNTLGHASERLVDELSALRSTVTAAEEARHVRAD